MKEIDLAIVGDIAWNHDITPNGQKTSPGGAVYYSAVGASYFSKDVGVVARVGGDFNLDLLKDRDIDIEGIKVILGEKTCRFVLTQHSDNTREFEAYRGTAGVVETNIFPDNYKSALFIHLPTQLPQHSLIWLDFLDGHSRVSVDSFETFVKQFPDLTKVMFKKASIIFTNESEYKTLKQLGSFIFDKPIIIKKGKYGAAYISPKETVYVTASEIKAIETTGAGDVLAGAFLAQRAKGINVREALINAVNIASLSVTEFGVEHIPWKEIMNKKPELITAAIIFNQEGRMFLGKSPKFKNTWIIPGGHFELNETPQNCIKREIKEELGVEIVNIKLLRENESFASEYKGGTKFYCWNFVANMNGSDVKICNEYSDYGFFLPQEALKISALHHTARNIINFLLEK